MTTDADAAIKIVNQHLKNKMLDYLPTQGLFATPIDGFMLARHDETSKTENCFYQPTIGLIVQGYKASVIGNVEYRYQPYHYMVASVDMPGVNHLFNITPENPFLALSIKLDRELITQLLTEFSTLPTVRKENGDNYPVAIILEKASYDIFDAFLRLLELLDNPERIPILAPMIIREIHYHLLTGPKGEQLRTLCTLGTQANRIAQTVNWLRENYKRPLNIKELAKRAHMAPSSFHRHFRRITTLSPLQFQKRLRLYEAEKLMLLENKDAITAALEVGYESGTQFNREYKRQFGEPPFRDIAKKRLLSLGSDE